MLFSTDWFVPYWSILRIEAKTEQRTFQNSCREIVLQLIGAAEDYYQIDFSAARIENTRQSLRTLAHNCNLVQPTVTRLEDMTTHQSGRDQLQKTAWLFGIVRRELQRDDELDEPIKSVVADSRRKFSVNDDLDLERLCLESPTEWDGYVRNLTPEMPASLAHLVTTALLPVAELTEVLAKLTKQQRELLHLRFRVAAKVATGVERELDWAELNPIIVNNRRCTHFLRCAVF